MQIIESKLPKIENLSFIQLFDDVFICAQGFEERTKAALNLLSDNEYKCKYSVLMKYNKNLEENNKYYDKIKQYLDNITLINSFEIEYDLDNFELMKNNKNISHNSLYQFCYKNNVKKISIDISSFNTSSIIQILDILLRTNLESLRIIYTSGKKYPPPKKPEYKIDDYNLYGIKNIKTLPNFSGIYTPGYSPLYIFILGFDPIRTINVLRKYQPSKKIGIFGESSQEDFMQRLDAQIKMYEYMFSTADETYTSSSFDYLNTYNILDKIYMEHGELTNITIIPLGSKMQTIATLLFLEKYQDVKLLLPIPYNYDPKNYAIGIGKSFQINFKMIKEITE